MLFTLTECPSKCMLHNLKDTVDLGSLTLAANDEYLICTSCAWSCATALRSSMTAENHQRLLPSTEATPPISWSLGGPLRRAALV